LKTARPLTPRLQGPSGPIALYWFSQLIGPDRGLEDVILAMAQLPPGAFVVHLRGDSWPGYEASLRALAARCGVADRQIVVHPIAQPDEMVRLAAAHDIGLALEPGRTENSDLALGNKVFTYLLGGLAIVTTRTSAHRWFVDQVPRAAVGYDAGDASGLQARLHHWLAHPAELEAARQAAWAYGDQRFNWDVEQHVFLDLVRSTLQTAPASAAGRRRVSHAPSTPVASAR